MGRGIEIHAPIAVSTAKTADEVISLGFNFIEKGPSSLGNARKMP